VIGLSVRIVARQETAAAAGGNFQLMQVCRKRRSIFQYVQPDHFFAKRRNVEITLE
jgi:hypothetical protein